VTANHTKIQNRRQSLKCDNRTAIFVISGGKWAKSIEISCRVKFFYLQSPQQQANENFREEDKSHDTG